MAPWQSQSLAAAHFGGARLFDQRRSRRLLDCARRILEHPAGSLPQKMGDDAATQGLYGLLACPDVRHDNVLAPHRQRTLEQMQQHAVVLVVHDATELDYSHIAALQGQLGTVSNHRRWGYICHNSLALTPQKQVLGLAHQILHRRRQVPKGEGRQARREHRQRESRLWIAGCSALGSAPPGQLRVNLCDRGADSFEFLAWQLQHGQHFVLRCAQDRTLAGEDHVGVDRIYQKLFAYARDLPRLGEKRVQVQSAGQGPAKPGQKLPVVKRPGRSARSTQVQVAAGRVSLQRPHYPGGQVPQEQLELWMVCVQELAPPAGEAPLEWLLLTDQPCSTLAQACQVIAWYECRPVIEDYHKGMKTGLGIEQLQIENAAHLEPAIALLSVAAAALLQLRHAAQDPDLGQQPAQTLLPELHLQVLSQWRWHQQRPMTLQEAAVAIARLGGHLNRRPPGWQTLWRGWSRLQDMVQGAALLPGRNTS